MGTFWLIAVVVVKSLFALSLIIGSIGSAVLFGVLLTGIRPTKDKGIIQYLVSILVEWWNEKKLLATCFVGWMVYVGIGCLVAPALTWTFQAGLALLAIVYGMVCALQPHRRLEMALDD